MWKHTNTGTLIIGSVGLALFFLGLGGVQLATATDSTQPAPTQEQLSANSEDVQNRGISRGTFGGIPTVPAIDPGGPVGFSCSAKTKTCSCRQSTPGDCKLMNTLVCGSKLDCPGSSQTCTCKALK